MVQTRVCGLGMLDDGLPPAILGPPHQIQQPAGVPIRGAHSAANAVAAKRKAPGAQASNISIPSYRVVKRRQPAAPDAGARCQNLGHASPAQATCHAATERLAILTVAISR